MVNRIVTPEQYLGFAVGSDRCLADWNQIVGYYQMLGTQCPRVKVEEIGKSTEGRPFLLATITSPANHARLEELRLIQGRLADPRGLSENEAAELIELGKTIVLITLSIHATEVGGSQMGLELAYELATGRDPETLEVLENTILLLVPSLNPDGLDLVVDWYKRYLGTPYEGTAPPYLYQKYTGHDNNRDWFMFTQQETRLAIEHIHNKWHPQIVHDQHQQGPDGARMVLPPFIDPYDENVDPVIRQEVAWLGQVMAAELTGLAKPGVITNVIYDAFSPSRAYQHYHGGVRILSEAASVRIASPIKRSFKDLQAGRGFDPKVATWNHPEPWQGGEWKLRDIVDYDKIIAWACLKHAAKYRRQWLRNFFLVGQRAVGQKRSVYAYLIPEAQKDSGVAAELLHVLAFGAVEIHQAKAAFTADGVDYGAGTFVVLVNQPYGAFAKTLLEKQHYPDLRLFPGGPPKKPYDITAHSLPIQMGVTAIEVRSPFIAELTRVVNLPNHLAVPPNPDLGGEWLYIRPEANRAHTVLFKLLAAGVTVYRLKRESECPVLPSGTLVVSGAARALVAKCAEEYGVHVGSFASIEGEDLAFVPRFPRVGLYRSFVANADEGWLRFVLEEYELPYVTLWDTDIRRGDLHKTFDVIIFPSAGARVMSEGIPANSYPAEFCGGLGDVGVESLRAFAEGGGSIIALDAACDWLTKELSLPVTNALSSASENEFFVPGSFLRVVLDINHPLAYGMPREAAVVFVRSPAFVVDGVGEIVGRYPMVNPLLSGWILGPEKLFGKSALVECPVGKGKAVLFGFRPHHRAQARGTYKILFNALINSVMP